MDIPWIAAQFPLLSDLQPLAQGGQKVVFAAQHASDGDVVLKLLLRSSDGQRLEREVLAGQLVECERVPRVFETGASVAIPRPGDESVAVDHCARAKSPTALLLPIDPTAAWWPALINAAELWWGLETTQGRKRVPVVLAVFGPTAQRRENRVMP